MPLHVGKGRNISTAISDIIDYVENPQKTDFGKFIYGYECDTRLADAEFLLSKRQYANLTGRNQGADDVIAYHLRQAFKPGEVTPEEANQIGRELALKLTKGNHAFVVCTHVDKHHALGEIDLETYRTRKAVYDTELVQAKNVHAVITAQTKQIKSDYEIKLKQQEIVQEVGNANMLTKALIDRLINKVYVFPGDRIEIEYATQDFLETKESEKEV